MMHMQFYPGIRARQNSSRYSESDLGLGPHYALFTGFEECGSIDVHERHMTAASGKFFRESLAESIRGSGDHGDPISVMAQHLMYIADAVEAGSRERHAPCGFR